jgi:hypothetical protein
LQASSNPSLLYPSSYPFYPPPKLHHYSAHQVPRQFLTPPDQLTACCHNWWHQSGSCRLSLGKTPPLWGY